MSKKSGTKATVVKVARSKPVQLPEADIDPDKIYSWESQVVQYPLFGIEGVTAHMPPMGHRLSGLVNTLLWRDNNGMTRGILNYYPAGVGRYEARGNANIFVDPHWRRQGIATKLFLEADNRWDIDLTAQRFSPDGRLLALFLAEKRGHAGARQWMVARSGVTEQVPEIIS